MDKRHDYNPFEEYEPTTKASAEEIPQEHYVIAETIVEEATEKTSWLQEVYEWTQAIAVAVVLALIINQFVLFSYYIYNWIFGSTIMGCI